MNVQKYLRNFLYFLQTANTQVLIVVPFLVGLCCFGLLTVTGATYTGKSSQNILISLGFLCWAVAGVPKIVRQESVYGPLHLYGRLAVTDGIINILLGLALASIPILVWGR